VAPTLKLPPLPLEQWRLANGLQVVASPDPGAGTVAVQMWYRVGGKDDPPGRSGFAHLFEHMMFKSTANMPAEMIDRLTEDVGGQNNAFTTEDATVYQNEVPANHLERLLWAEAERLAGLKVDQLNFDSERAVVQEELRQRVLAEPYGRLFEALYALAFERHPYRRGVIGSIEELQAATLDDVRRFHATFYRPDNVVLVVAGGFDRADLRRWVDRYFGPIQAPASPVPRVDARALAERAWTRDRRVPIKAPNVPLPAVVLVWQGPPIVHRDSAALRMASALLSSGESSRLNQSLVYRQRIAQQAGFYAELSADAGMLVGYAMVAAGVSPGVVEQALLQQVRSLATGPLGEGELGKVRTQLLTAMLSRRQSPAGRAEALGRAALVRGDAGAAERELPELEAVSARDVQRSLQSWLLARRRKVAHYSAEAA
jgi:zinc protease